MDPAGQTRRSKTASVWQLESLQNGMAETTSRLGVYKASNLDGTNLACVLPSSADKCQVRLSLLTCTSWLSARHHSSCGRHTPSLSLPSSSLPPSTAHPSQVTGSLEAVPQPEVCWAQTLLGELRGPERPFLSHFGWVDAPCSI